MRKLKDLLAQARRYSARAMSQSLRPGIVAKDSLARLREGLFRSLLERPRLQTAMRKKR